MTSVFNFFQIRCAAVLVLAASSVVQAQDSDLDLDLDLIMVPAPASKAPTETENPLYKEFAMALIAFKKGDYVRARQS